MRQLKVAAIAGLLLLLTIISSIGEERIFLYGWIEREETPKQGGYGEAVIGTGDAVYVVRCLYASSDPEFWRYDPYTDTWYSMSTYGLPTGAFRNGACLAYDYNMNIYALMGARYSDANRTLFYVFNFNYSIWMRLPDAPHPQGAGNALTYCGYDNSLYAFLGSCQHGSVFARYDIANSTWEILPSIWDVTDDGCSLAWAGDKYIYALQGEADESMPNCNFARFNVVNRTWEELSPMPEENGVGDGASLLWIGYWNENYKDCIFALGGGDVDENPGYNFYCYYINNDTWVKLDNLPYPVGYYNGNRLAYANNSIYYWQGTPSTWEGGGNKFCQFILQNISAAPTVVYVDDDYNSSTPRWQFDHFNKIQDAIDAVAENGTVYVYNGTYYENIEINKTLSLIGESADNTIIDGNKKGTVINITADGVKIEGFTVTNCYPSAFNQAGICIYSNNNSISNCKIIYNQPTGIRLINANNNKIEDCNISHNSLNIVLAASSGNEISNCFVGYGSPTFDADNITVVMPALNLLEGSNNNTIKDCFILNNSEGISVSGNENVIFKNRIMNNEICGIYIESCNNVIRDNEIIGNGFYENISSGYGGMWLIDSTSGNNIYHNNFINNRLNAWDEGTNQWDNGKEGNYWDDYYGYDSNGDGIGDVPYDIPGGNNKDRYPLMHYIGFLPTIKLIPQHVVAAVNTNISFDIVIDRLPAGLSGYNITVSVFVELNATFVPPEIVGVEFPSWATIHANSSLPSDQIWIKAVDLDNEIKENATNVTLATVKISLIAVANTTVNLQINKLDDDNGYPINVVIQNATIKVVYLPPLPSCSQSPTDPDGDGIFEDLNGNGLIDFDDVVKYFHYLEWIEANYPVEAVDFNGNGLVDFDDIVELFMEV